MPNNEDKKKLTLSHCARSAIIYSSSGGGKTTNLYFMAKWLWEKKKLKTRLISAGGGDLAPFYDSGMVDEGIADVYNIDASKTPLADITRLSNGYWPRGKAQVLRDDPRCLTTAEEVAELGMVAVDHITGLANLFLSHLGTLEDNAGFKHSLAIREEELFLGGLQEGHYGIVQGICHRVFTKGFLLLPIPFVIATALEGIGRQKKTSETVYGPATCGAAQVADVPSWFGDTIHLEILKKDVELDNGATGEQTTFNAWFMQHVDPKTDIMYLAKPRVLPEYLPTLIKWGNGEGRIELSTERGIDRYFEAIEKLKERGRQKRMEGK